MKETYYRNSVWLFHKNNTFPSLKSKSNRLSSLLESFRLQRQLPLKFCLIFNIWHDKQDKIQERLTLITTFCPYETSLYKTPLLVETLNRKAQQKFLVIFLQNGCTQTKFKFLRFFLLNILYLLSVEILRYVACAAHRSFHWMILKLKLITLK